MAETSEARVRELIGLALETFRDEILPDLPGGHRYQGAMVANALAIAERLLDGDGESGSRVAAMLGMDGMSNAELAGAIRGGEVSDQTHPALRAALMNELTAELNVTNPRFLARRRT